VVFIIEEEGKTKSIELPTHAKVLKGKGKRHAWRKYIWETRFNIWVTTKSKLCASLSSTHKSPKEKPI